VKFSSCCLVSWAGNAWMPRRVFPVRRRLGVLPEGGNAARQEVSIA
jgi:hypothetical protein